ncbi:hypothetical protein [Laceyella putida]|uniref:Uncharacterized protein n=1 Tax=Laceyella putida TaxID=110101 RepID=A0ABW2RLV8_9BACL
MKQRQMALTVKNVVGQGNQQAQQENVSGLQGWTWWQQLIGVEMLIGGMIVFWYYCVEVYYEAKFGQYNIPLDYVDFSFNSIIEPSKYLTQYIVVAVLCIFMGADIRNKPIYYVNAFLLCSAIMLTNITFLGLSKATIIFASNIIFFGASILVVTRFYTIIFMQKTEILDKFVIRTSKGFVIFIYLISSIMCLIFIPFVMTISGLLSSTNSKFYIIEQNKQPKVVLDTYKDYYITAPVNIKNKTFKPEFELIPMHKDDNDPPVKVVKDTKELNQAEKQEEKIVLKYMEIGPLRSETPSKP